MASEGTFGPAFHKPLSADYQSAIKQTDSLRYIGSPWFC